MQIAAIWDAVFLFLFRSFAVCVSLIANGGPRCSSRITTLTGLFQLPDTDGHFGTATHRYSRHHHPRIGCLQSAEVACLAPELAARSLARFIVESWLSGLSSIIIFNRLKCVELSWIVVSLRFFSSCCKIRSSSPLIQISTFLHHGLMVFVLMFILPSLCGASLNNLARALVASEYNFFLFTSFKLF